MKNKILIAIFLMLQFAAFSQVYYPKVNSGVYDSELFNSTYSNEFYRNKFTAVIYGDTLTKWWFVDYQGARAEMVLGASGGGSGGSVSVNSPLAGNGTLGSPLDLINGARQTDFLSFDSVAQNWVVSRTAYNTNLSTTAGATGNFQITDGKQTLTIPKASIAPVQQVTGSAEIQVVNLGSANYGINLEPQGATNGQVLTYNGTRYAPATPTGGLPALTDGKIWVGNGSNVATAVTPSKDALVNNAGAVTVRGASQYWGITNSYTYAITGNTNNLFVNGSRAILAPTVSANITGLVTSLNAGKIVTLKNENNLNSFPITLINQSASSLDTNRFNIGSDFILNPGKTVTFLHDSGRWIFYAQGQSTLIDTFSYVGSTLSLSLQNDGVPSKTVTISGGGSQTLQQVITTGSTLTAQNTINNSTGYLRISGRNVREDTLVVGENGAPKSEASLTIRKPLTNASSVLMAIPTIQGDTVTGVRPFGNYYANIDETFTNSDGQKDAVWTQGYNVSAGGGRRNTNEAEFHQAIESHFIGGGTSPTGDFEYHIQSTAKNGVANRHMSMNVQKATGVASCFFALDQVDFRTTTAGVSYLNAAPALLNYQGGNGLVRFKNAAGTRVMQFQVDNAGVSYIDMPTGQANIGGMTSLFFNPTTQAYCSAPFLVFDNKELTVRYASGFTGPLFQIRSSAGPQPIYMNIVDDDEAQIQLTGSHYVALPAGTTASSYLIRARKNGAAVESFQVNTTQAFFNRAAAQGTYALTIGGSSYFDAGFYSAGTGADRVQSGTTAQRPSGAVGEIRHNSTTGNFEGVRAGTTYERIVQENAAFNAEVLSYDPTAGKYISVVANRSTFLGPGTTVTPAESVTEIFAADATASTVNLNYTPGASFNDPYTTTRWIYNTGVGACTVQTNQAWQFRSMAAVDTATITLTAGQACKLIWNSTLSRWFYKIM